MSKYIRTKDGIIVDTTKYKNVVQRTFNGKVVARFWCDKVDTFRCNITGNLKDGFFKAEPYCKDLGDGTTKYILCSMNREERRRYKTELDLKINNEIAVIKDNYKLTRVPQSYCFIEVDL